jgi:LmbE family N-acetylglucosaminyl deacetylase
MIIQSVKTGVMGWFMEKKILQVEQFTQILKKETSPISLEDYFFSPSLRLLVLAPHPDDFDAIAVMLKYFQANSNQILLLVLTGGSSGVNDSFLEYPTKHRKAKIRETEQIYALEFFGFPLSHVRFLRLSEDEQGDMILDNGCRKSVGKLFQEFDPDMIALPYGEDSNPSHQRTFALARQLATAASKPVLAFDNQDPKTIRIRLDAYIAFDHSTSLWKREMLRFHQSQQTRNLETRDYGFDERILKVNQAIAKELKIDQEYAEGFQIELFEPAQ